YVPPSGTQPGVRALLALCWGKVRDKRNTATGFSAPECEQAGTQVPLPALWDGALGPSRTCTFLSSVLRAFTHWLCHQAFANPEDALRHGGLQFHRDDQDVERCLRAHRNDMETIYPFLFLGLVYSFLGPDPFVAQMHFLVFFLGRMVHTVAYLGKLRAPTRSLAYTVAQLPCASMALQIVWEAARHL
uniref:Prostaglandin E synthase n=1 Tax=Equus caballus TaxID=9796 RepID=A0A9L0SRK8_HORSE